MSANVREGRCKYECRSTWHGNHGPGLSLPGTHGKPGDVRRCEHGNVWVFEREYEGRFYTQHDGWRRLHPILDWPEYRRAVAALAAGDPQ